MFLISFILLALTFLFILWFLKNYIWYKLRVDRLMKKVNLWKGGLPIVGNTFLFSKVENNQDLYNLVNLLSEGIIEDKRLWLMNIHLLVASKLNTIEKVLTSPDAVEKSILYSYLNIFVDGVFIAPTNKWRKMRKRLNTTFTPKYYPDYINQINYQTKIFVDKFKKREENQNRYVNVLPYVSNYFFDIVTMTHFGVNTKQQYYRGINIAHDVSKNSSLAYRRINRPWLHLDFIFHRTKLYKKIKGLQSQTQPFTDNLMIKSEEFQNKIDSEGNPLGWKSYATHCREYLEEERIKTTPYLIGHTAIDLVVAGTDTGSVAISNVLYQLGKNPQYQELAYKEIMEILQEDACSDSENLSYSHDAEWEYSKSIPSAFGFWTRNKMDRLRFMDMLIKESLRLCSPPLVLRRLTSDLDVGDYIIPKETEIMIMIKSIHRNPLYWDKPEEFYPEHFTPEKVKARPKYAFLPFSHGPRDCPGKLYAMYVMKCVLVEIIRNFKIEVEPREDIKYKMVFMIEHVDGYPVKFVPRHSNIKI